MPSLTAASDALRKVLSLFFDNVDDLEIDLWEGIVRLRDLALKPSVLDALDLPIGLADVHGSLGEVLLEVPWRSALFGTPMSLSISNINLVLRGISSPARNPFDAAAAARQAADAMQKRLAAWQLLEDQRDASHGAPVRTLVDRLASLVASRLQVRVDGVHVRVEEPHAGESLVVGVSLRSLTLGDLPAGESVDCSIARDDEAAARAADAARTASEEDSSRVRKQVEVTDLAFYVGHGQSSHVLEPLSLRLTLSVRLQGQLVESSTWAALRLASPLTITLRHEQLLTVINLVEVNLPTDCH